MPSAAELQCQYDFAQYLATVANIGARKVTELCRQLESLLRTNPSANLHACRQFAAEIDTALKFVLNEIHVMSGGSQTRAPVKARAKKSAGSKG